MIPLSTGALTEIAVVGAHCDDIAIGMGGTLSTLSRNAPGLRVRALVVSGGGTEREAEELDALAAFCPGADVEVALFDIPDGRAPAHWERIKNHLSEFRRSCAQRWCSVRYEILKWQNDTTRPAIFHPLESDVAEEKARLLLKHYTSQTSHDRFNEQAFLGREDFEGYSVATRTRKLSSWRRR